MTYGPGWWGPTYYFDYIGDSTVVSLISTLFTLMPYPPAQAIGYGLWGCATFSVGHTYYGFVEKYYQEVYVNGMFAYFRTTYYTYLYWDPDYNYFQASYSASYDNTQPMVIAQPMIAAKKY